MLEAETLSTAFPPSTSRQPLLRRGDQNARVLIPDAVRPRADGAPLVRAAVGFTHEFEEPRARRRRIEPVVKSVALDDRRLSMVNVCEPRGGRRRDDGKGLVGFAALVPAVPRRGER